MGVEFTGVNELRVALKKKAGLDAVKKVVQYDGAKLQKAAQRNAPVDTGFLKRSIGLEIQDSGLTAKSEATAEYAGYQEWGTRFMEAQPYMKPAFDEVKGEFKRHMDALTK